MSTISVDQRFALFAKLGENMDWDSLTAEQVQVGIREAHSFAAREFETFIQNGFRMQIGDFSRETGEVTIRIPALPRPTLTELQSKFGWVKEIERDTSPTEAVTFKLGTVFRSNDERIDGGEYERRITRKLDIMLGYQQAVWLVEHQSEFPAFMTLSRNVYIDFPCLVVVNAHGHRRFPGFSEGGWRWIMDWRWFENSFGWDGRIAISGK